MRAAPFLAAVIVCAAIASPPAMARNVKKLNTPDRWDTEAVDTMNDPWQCINRPIFRFNLGFDRHIAKPVITVYDKVPSPVRHAIGNFLSNLSEPLNVIHGILQLKPKVAFTSLWRFLLNSTFGMGGIHDFAHEDAGLRNMDQNFGKTLGYWGLPAGPYIVLPIIGPSSGRDTTGKVGDWFADPIGWEMTTPEDVGQAVADGIDTRDSQSGVVEHLYYQSLDPYVATRSAYRQHEMFEAKTQE